MTTSVPPVSGVRTSAESATWAIRPSPRPRSGTVDPRGQSGSLVEDVEADVIVVALGFDGDRPGYLAVTVGMQDDVGGRLGDREGDIAQYGAILHVLLRPVDDRAAGLHRGFARSRE